MFKMHQEGKNTQKNSLTKACLYDIMKKAGEIRLIVADPASMEYERM
jgi:hypothetical protein